MTLPDISNNWGNFTEIPEDADISQFPFPREIWEVRPTWEVVLKVGTIAPVVTVGLVGNGCLINAIVRTKALQTTTNLFILNMAIADFGASLLCPWLFVCVDIFQNYMFGVVGCKLEGFLLQVTTLVAVFSLSAISYDRLCAIVFNCSDKLSLRNARILVLVSRIIALAVSVPLAFFRKYHERRWKNYLETFCTETRTAIPYWHIFVGLSVWTPLTIMAICYTIILIKLYKYKTVALKSKHSMVIKYKRRVTRILALVVLAFIVCRVPFTGLVILRAQMSKNFGDIKFGQAGSMYGLWYVSRYLVFVSAALNPLLYGYTSTSLRQELISRPPFSWLLMESHHQEIDHLEIHAQVPRAFEINCLPKSTGETLRPRSPCITG